MIGSIVPNHMNDALVAVAALNLSQKLDRAPAIDRRWFNEGGVEILQVHRAMDIDPSPACRGFDHRILSPS